MARILIAGCGYLGTALGLRLSAQGHNVWGLRREPSGLPKGIRPFEADLSNAESLFLLPSELDYVFYTAGAPAFTERAYQQTYVTGLRHLLGALRKQGKRPRRVVYTSSTGVYAQESGEWVDETSETGTKHFSGAALIEGEELLERSGFEGVVLRLGGIYGPRRATLVRQVRDGVARLEADASRFLNLIHVDDAVAALMLLMRLERPHPVYIGVDREPQDRNSLLEWLARVLDAPMPPVSDERQSKRPRRNRRCSSARLAAAGLEFRYPSARQGYQALIDSGDV